MDKIIKKGSAVWLIIEKDKKFLQKDNTFKDSLTDVAKFVDYEPANNAAEATNGNVRRLEINEFKIY